MTGTCPECGKEYPVKTLRLDPGFCPEHKPGFLSKPIWFLPTQAGTKAVWQYVVGMHIFYLLFFPLLLDCGTVSVPGSLYSVTVVAHFAIRFFIARRKGFPILTRTQTVGLLLLPFYGLVGFIWLFHSVQMLKYGE